MGLAQAVGDRGFEGGKVGVVVGIQALFLDELPEPFDQVEIGGVGGQETQFDLQLGGGSQDQGAFLIAGVVEKHADGCTQAERRQLVQQGADLFGGDVRVVGHRDQFVGDGIQGSQHIEPLAARGCPDEQAGQRPEEAQKGRQHEMGGIDEKHGALPGAGFGQSWFDLLLEIGRLGVRVGLGRDHPHPATAQLEFFSERRAPGSRCAESRSRWRSPAARP